MRTSTSSTSSCRSPLSTDLATMSLMSVFEFSSCADITRRSALLSSLSVWAEPTHFRSYQPALDGVRVDGESCCSARAQAIDDAKLAVGMWLDSLDAKHRGHESGPLGESERQTRTSSAPSVASVRQGRSSELPDESATAYCLQFSSMRRSLFRVACRASASSFSALCRSELRRSSSRCFPASACFLSCIRALFLSSCSASA